MYVYLKKNTKKNDSINSSQSGIRVGYKHPGAQLHPRLHQGSDEKKDMLCVFILNVLASQMIELIAVLSLQRDCNVDQQTVSLASR